jgi:hypothetical protein
MVLKNGQVVKDEKTLQPVEPTKFITDEIAKLDLVIKNNGGSGGSDETGGSPEASYDKFVKEMEKAGKPEGTQEFAEEMSKRLKEGTLKM